MVRVPAGDVARSGEDQRVAAFDLDTHEVTNSDFAAFVDATGFETEAERWGWSLVFHPEDTANPDLEQRVAGTPWWLAVEGAYWRHPRGPDSVAEADLPVVHVSWGDARAYCDWRGKRLPTEAEWDLAAGAGNDGEGRAHYPWGDEPAPEGQWVANVWQGDFPRRDDAADGHTYLAPVGSYPPNALGVFDLGGNVWEWVDDWYRPGGAGGEKVLKGRFLALRRQLLRGLPEREPEPVGARLRSRQHRLPLRPQRSLSGDFHGFLKVPIVQSYFEKKNLQRSTFPCYCPFSSFRTGRIGDTLNPSPARPEAIQVQRGRTK